MNYNRLLVFLPYPYFAPHWFHCSTSRIYTTCKKSKENENIFYESSMALSFLQSFVTYQLSCKPKLQCTPFKITAGYFADGCSCTVTVVTDLNIAIRSGIPTETENQHYSFVSPYITHFTFILCLFQAKSDKNQNLRYRFSDKDRRHKNKLKQTLNKQHWKVKRWHVETAK